jgi:hypothetical protein
LLGLGAGLGAPAYDDGYGDEDSIDEDEEDDGEYNIGDMEVAF